MPDNPMPMIDTGDWVMVEGCPDDEIACVTDDEVDELDGLPPQERAEATAGILEIRKQNGQHWRRDAPHTP